MRRLPLDDPAIVSILPYFIKIFNLSLKNQKQYNKKMALGFKLIIGIFVIILFITGFWIYSSLKQSQIKVPEDVIINPNNTIIELTTDPSNISDAALGVDLTIIDKQLDVFSENFSSLNSIFSAGTKNFNLPENSNLSIATIINRANSETETLNNSLSLGVKKINLLNNISEEGKADLVAKVQAKIDEINSLNDKISMETNRITAITTYQSMVGPLESSDMLFSQVVLILAVDDALTIAKSATSLSGKIKLRIAKLSGPNIKTLNQIVTRLEPMVSVADDQARLSIKNILYLDFNNSTLKQTNIATMDSSLQKLNTVNENLHSSRKEIGTLVKYLKEIK